MQSYKLLNDDLTSFIEWSGIKKGKFGTPTKWLYLYYKAYCEANSLEVPGFKRFSLIISRHLPYDPKFVKYIGQRPVSNVAQRSLRKWIRINYPDTKWPDYVITRQNKVKSKKHTRLFFPNKLGGARPIVDSMGRVYSSIHQAVLFCKVNAGRIAKILNGTANHTRGLIFWYLTIEDLQYIPKDAREGQKIFTPVKPLFQK